MSPCRREVVEVELGRGEMRKGVEPTAEIVVRETVDERCGFGAICLPLCRATAHCAREGTYGERRCDQRLVAERAAASTARLAQARIAS